MASARQPGWFAWAWLLLASGFLALSGLACGAGDDASQRITRLAILEAGESFHSGTNNFDPATNGEATVARALIDPHDTVVDAGAYVGDWSRLVSDHQPTARIYAFEPAPDTYPKLEKAVQHTRIVPVELALSDRAGVAVFQVYEEGPVLNSFYERKKLRQRNVNPVAVDVTTVRLDAWCREQRIDHVDYLKIDTEGAELLVLRGAGEMLEARSISLVQFEYGGTYPDAGITLKDVFALLRGHGYHIYRILPDGLLDMHEWQDAYEDYQYSNFLAAASSP